jgi:hypothetical protein
MLRRLLRYPLALNSARGQQLNAKIGRTVCLVREPGGEVELVSRSNRD